MEMALPRVTGRHRNRALALERRRRAVELVLTGSTYQQAAQELGYPERCTAWSSRPCGSGRPRASTTFAPCS
jgi:hypothetical protein